MSFLKFFDRYACISPIINKKLYPNSNLNLENSQIQFKKELNQLKLTQPQLNNIVKTLNSNRQPDAIIASLMIFTDNTHDVKQKSDYQYTVNQLSPFMLSDDHSSNLQFKVSKKIDSFVIEKFNKTNQLRTNMPHIMQNDFPQLFIDITKIFEQHRTILTSQFEANCNHLITMDSDQLFDQLISQGIYNTLTYLLFHNVAFEDLYEVKNQLIQNYEQQPSLEHLLMTLEIMKYVNQQFKIPTANSGQTQRALQFDLLWMLRYSLNLLKPLNWDAKSYQTIKDELNTDLKLCHDTSRNKFKPSKLGAYNPKTITQLYLNDFSVKIMQIINQDV